MSSSQENSTLIKPGLLLHARKTLLLACLQNLLCITGRGLALLENMLGEEMTSCFCRCSTRIHSLCSCVFQLQIAKHKGEILGVVVVESGWGSILPTVILANMMNGGPAARSGKLSIGDQIMSINGTSLVGLPLATCQGIIKVPICPYLCQLVIWEDGMTLVGFQH